MIGFVTTSLSYTALADEKPEIRQKKLSANKNNLQVQRKTTRQSNTKARKIEPSRQQRLDQARQKRRRSREQDPTDRFFDLRFKDLTMDRLTLWGLLKNLTMLTQRRSERSYQALKP